MPAKVTLMNYIVWVIKYYTSKNYLIAMFCRVSIIYDYILKSTNLIAFLMLNINFTMKLTISQDSRIQTLKAIYYFYLVQLRGYLLILVGLKISL